MRKMENNSVDKNLIVKKNKKLVVLLCLFAFLIIFYIVLVLLNLEYLNGYNNKMFPNVFIEELDMSNVSYNDALERLDYYDDFILSKKIIVNANDERCEVSLDDLGASINKKKTIDKIKNYQKSLKYSKKIKMINGDVKKVFSFSYDVDSEKLRNFVNSFKSNVDRSVINGYFDTSKGVRYVSGTNGYSLDVESSINSIFNALVNNIDYDKDIVLSGEVSLANNNDRYMNIDTMTSSFVTVFMPNTYLRNINLNTALSYINGSIVEPGEIFSYCQKAGPFNKYGYVFYYEFVGNGVCQIATTTYNAALLGGLEIVKRYPHDKKSLYVDGGLDATVASYSSGWCVDMQFKNTYDYPIYIKAYSEGGRAHVEFWSNKDAKRGLEYTISSVQIGQRGYRSYLHTWKDGKEIDVKEIATTWYLKD